jgi:hypothetical protein
VLLAAAFTAGAAVPAHASWMIPPAPYRAKDFCLVKARDGLYHVFYIRSNVTLTDPQTANDFGHAVSPNFWSWTQLPAVLHTHPEWWDDLHVWAPSIVEVDSVYYMFYTGVSGGAYARYQRVGLATSTDLMTWNHLDTPVFDCMQVPWSFCDSLYYRTDFRDPFVMPEPPPGNGWLMYYSVAAYDDTSMMVGIAHSDGDLTQWQDLKPMWNTHRSMTGGTLTESPHAFQYNGLWYLFYTTFFRQPLQFQTSSDPTGELWEWTPRGSLSAMLNLETAAWYASEHLRDGLLDFFAFVEYDRVAIYRMTSSGAGYTFQLQQPDRFRVTRMAWDTDSARVLDRASLRLRSVEWFGKSVALEAVELLDDGTERSIPCDSLGLPCTVPMSADTTVVDWVVRTLADHAHPARALRLVVRTIDHTVSSPVLVIDPDSVAVTPPPPPPQDPPGPDPVEPGTDEPAVRPLHFSPLGVPSLLVEMPSEGAARVDLFDAQGRRVRNLADRVLPRGATVLPWDGRDARGQAAPPGVYFVRLQSTRGRAVTRFAYLP